jgi:putative phosphoribosyl transferase
MIFKDRADAGRALADELAPLIAPPCVVVAIPRGGVSVAMPIVERFRVPLTVVYARKLTARVAPELAFGALDEDGEMITDPSTVDGLGLGPHDIEAARARTAAEITRRMVLYRVPPLAHYLPGSTVVLVDDGLATGLTMQAALAYARRHGAARIIVAVPCAAAQAAAHFRRAADHFVSLTVDEDFAAVGEYYEDFSPVSDDEVVAMLTRAAGLVPALPPARAGGRVSFENARGVRLAGVLQVPETPGLHPVVVFCHGWGSGKDSPRNTAVAEALRAEGFATFLFDFTGHGESEGAVEESTPGQQDDDLRAALDVLKTAGGIDPERIGVAGASSGAAVALTRAAVDSRIRALALRSANPEGADAAASKVTVPTLLVVGEYDAPIRDANEALLRRLRGPRRHAVVPGGDHLFEDPRALREAIRLMVAWFKEHLVGPPAADRRGAPARA